MLEPHIGEVVFGYVRSSRMPARFKDSADELTRAYEAM